MMTDEVRQEVDQIREEIRQIGATLKSLRRDLDDIDRVKTGPQGEIDLPQWNQAEAVREKIRDCVSRRDTVQGRLNDLLRPFRARKVVPVLREKGLSVRELVQSVREKIPEESPSARHLLVMLDEALSIEDEGRSLGLLLDHFLFGEIRRAVEAILEIAVSNGNGK